MGSSDTIIKQFATDKSPSVPSDATRESSDLRSWFAQYAGNFGSTLLESSLFAYGRGKRTFAAVDPIDSWSIKANQEVPSDWIQQLDSFLADDSAFYALFFSYDFGVEIVSGSDSLGDSSKGEFKALALKYSNFRIEDNSASDRDISEQADSPQEILAPARIVSRPDRAEYFEKLAQLKSHIYEGDIYQANLTVEWQIATEARPWDVYCRLQDLNPCQYGGFANLGDYTVMSSSPERLISVEDGVITANPIKGTITKGESAAEVERNTESLLNSPKDRAELLMIVDLLRNDLGKVCRAGSVRTPQIWRPEIYSSLIHLAAEIQGELRPEVSVGEALNAVFPGGSITGAPKRRAVRILREIEGRRRGIYTGSFGYKYGSTLDLNIAIRTLTHVEKVDNPDCDSGVYFAQAGGGIVADSDAESEFEEAALKVGNLLKAIDPELSP